MRFEDTKVFLVNSRAIQHWGTRGEFIRVETWDTVVSLNVFGNVHVLGNLFACRSLNHIPTFFSGCTTAPNPVPANPTSTSNCNIRDTFFWRASISFQFYDVAMRKFSICGCLRKGD
jgi:hypothetical protein